MIEIALLLTIRLFCLFRKYSMYHRKETIKSNILFASVYAEALQSSQRCFSHVRHFHVVMG